MLYFDVRYLCIFVSRRLANLIHKRFILYFITHASEQYDQTVICLLNHLPSTHWNNMHDAFDHERKDKDFATRNGRQREAIPPPVPRCFPTRQTAIHYCEGLHSCEHCHLIHNE